MKEIRSKDNKTYKMAEQLKSKKYRDKLNKYLIEGENLLAEAVKNNVPVEVVFVKEGVDFFNKDWNSLEDIKNAVMDKLVVLDKNLFDKISETEQSQGIIAVVEKRKIELDECLANGEKGNYIVLDRLQDPGNIGTLIRTADGAGFKAVIVLKGSGDVYSSKVVRSATGSLFRIPIILLDTVSDLVDFVNKRNKKLVATSLDTDLFYYEVDLRENVAIIIGNEGNGISEELMNKADIRVKIPMVGNIESLNASVAGGILMYEALRK